MTKKSQELIETLFKGLMESLIQIANGEYVFKNNQTIYSTSLSYNGPNSDLPLEEEIFQYFEKEIVSKIPHALLLIKGNLSIEVSINKEINNKLKKTQSAKRELDIYKSFKTIFFPTMNEYLVKLGNSEPEWIYLAEKDWKVDTKDQNKKKFENGNYIKYIRGKSWISMEIEGTAISFLKDDIDFFFNNFKFKNPISVGTIILPQTDISLDEFRSKSKTNKKSYYTTDLYSSEQKKRFIQKLLENFIEWYPKFINDNFPRIRKSFKLYQNLPVKIILSFDKPFKDAYEHQDLWFFWGVEKLPNDSKNIVEMVEGYDANYDENKHFIARSTSTNYLIIDNQYNAFPFTYKFIREELEDILEGFENDSIFDEIKPFQSSLEGWIQIILDAEKRGGEDYNIELKSIPTESKEGDGSGNDIYGHINGFENEEGGYIFIGVDENKIGREKIVGLEGYLKSKKKTLDQLVREIRQKCVNYLKNDNYRIQTRTDGGISLIRITIRSNKGGLNWFYTKKGLRITYVRRNREKIPMPEHEIEERLSKKYNKALIK